MTIISPAKRRAELLRRKIPIKFTAMQGQRISQALGMDRATMERKRQTRGGEMIRRAIERGASRDEVAHIAKIWRITSAEFNAVASDIIRQIDQRTTGIRPELVQDLMSKGGPRKIRPELLENLRRIQVPQTEQRIAPTMLQNPEERSRKMRVIDETIRKLQERGDINGARALLRASRAVTSETNIAEFVRRTLARLKGIR